MQTITVPAWQAITILAVPSTLLFTIITALLLKKRRRKKKIEPPVMPTAAQSMPRLNSAVHNHLIFQQIDAVFNALCSIIETERIKLKTLIQPLNTDPGPELSVPSGPGAPSAFATSQTGQNISQTIANLLDNGVTPENIARELGLSQTEVNLAIKMRPVTASEKGNRLETVA
ncbi:MAG: hypothetical protein GY874_17155 [Desulfobacteraceae bacterium]|nr:hypothetical protein [Desulfobacteraceae bacterium]